MGDIAEAERLHHDILDMGPDVLLVNLLPENDADALQRELV